MTTPSGKVYLVGAGPGDPGLLTLRGRDLIAEAEAVLYDYLANPRLLSHCSEAAELVCLGRHGQARGRGRLVEQAEIHQQMIAAAQAGKNVVRLKGGDPSVFGRLGEETAALEAAGVAYEVVPGVTSALAASSYAGVPLTHREHASCVAFVTGQECRGKSGGALDLAGLAQFPGTLVFYMGVTTAPHWASELVAHGKPESTPTAIVRHASLPMQEVRITTLGELPTELETGRVRPPAIVIVGESVSARSTVEWFAGRKLFGKRILVTRPAGQADELVEQLESLGAAAIVQPAIEIAPPADWQPVDAAIERLEEFDWLVFSSSNGVCSFLDRLLASGRDMRALGEVKLASIGPATSQTLAEYCLSVDLEPEEYRAEALAELLAKEAVGKRFLLLRASRGREVLAETLRGVGANVEQAVVYESRDVAKSDEEIAAALEAGELDWATVTSSAIARSLIAMFGEQLRKTKLAAISPLTAGVLREAGFEAAAVAEQYTCEGLIAAMVAAEATIPA